MRCNFSCGVSGRGSLSIPCELEWFGSFGFDTASFVDDSFSEVSDSGDERSLNVTVLVGRDSLDGDGCDAGI